MKPISSRAIAVATFGLALPRATSRRKRVVRRSWAFHAISPRSLAAPLVGRASVGRCGHPLIGPRRFGQQAPRVRVAGLRNPAASYAGATRIFRGHEAEVRHQLARTREPSNIADLRDEAHRRDKRDPAQRLQRLHDRCPPPRRGELPELVREGLDVAFGLVDRVAVLLQRDGAAGQGGN